MRDVRAVIIPASSDTCEDWFAIIVDWRDFIGSE